jgi:class 3 adenylate cyclase
MTHRFRIPITTITVFGASTLLTVTVGIVLYLGFNQAANSTRQLWADQAGSLINAMEQSLEFQLRPIRYQSEWIAKDIHELSNLALFDKTVFGALAATPQVAGAVIVTADGHSRRWLRSPMKIIDENWSNRPEIVQWLEAVKTQGGPSWRAPIWAEQPVGSATLLHDIPIRDEAGRFIGAFAQIVPIAELSSFLSSTYADTGLTPFVLYDRQFVLAHPMLINAVFSSDTQQQPLSPIDAFGDIVLSRIWTPDEPMPFISKLLIDTQASGVFWGDVFYLFVYRDINRYGKAPWTIGAYINTSLQNSGELRRLGEALLAGLAVLVVAIAASVFVGRKVSNPIKAIVQAAHSVESGQFESVLQLPGSRIRELDDAHSAFNNMIQGLNERRLIRETLGRFVPEEVASSLLAGGGQIKPQQVVATILFCDIESFTQMTESLGPVKIVDVLNAFFSAMVVVLEKHGGVVTQFQGDAIMATFNVPVANADHATNAVLAGQEMLSQVAAQKFAGETLAIRVGVNTGPVVAGAIGAEGRLSYTVHGDAVNLAARLESLNKDYGTRLLVSENTKKLVQEIEFNQVGESRVRGQAQSILLYTLAVPTGSRSI